MAKITVCRAYSNFDKDYYDFFMVDDDVCLIPEKMFGKICSQCDGGHAVIRNFPFNNDVVGKISFSKKSLVMKREDDSIVEYVYMDNYKKYEEKKRETRMRLSFFCLFYY